MAACKGCHRGNRNLARMLFRVGSRRLQATEDVTDRFTFDDPPSSYVTPAAYGRTTPSRVAWCSDPTSGLHSPASRSTMR